MGLSESAYMVSTALSVLIGDRMGPITRRRSTTPKQWMTCCQGAKSNAETRSCLCFWEAQQLVYIRCGHTQLRHCHGSLDSKIAFFQARLHGMQLKQCLRPAE